MSCGVLIVGLGNIGMGYDLHLDPSAYVYSHARAFSQHSSFRLIAGVDVDEQRRRVFIQTYQCPVYEDIKTALRHHQPELVVVAVHTRSHQNTVEIVLAQSSPRVIVVEKPLAYDLEEAQRIVQACMNVGVKLYVNYMRRSDPGVLEIKRRLSCGEIKSPVKGLAWYSKGFLHNGSHFFNLLEYWLGSMRRSLILNSGRFLDEGDSEPDVHITFERGDVVFLAAWEEAFSHHTVELLSTSGRLRYERGGAVIQWQPTWFDPQLQDNTLICAECETIDSGMDRYQSHVVEQLARAILDQDAQLCTGADAFQTLKTMKEILGTA